MAFKQFLSDVHTAAGLVTHGKQCKALGERLGKGVMLYLTTPPAAQREWVGLSDLNIDELENEYMKSAQTAHEFLRAIEAKLRSKNNG